MITAFLIIILAVGQIIPHEGPTHNPSGGYIETCGDLPGLVGDDC